MGRRPLPSPYHTLPRKNPEPWVRRRQTARSPLCTHYWYYVHDGKVKSVGLQSRPGPGPQTPRQTKNGLRALKRTHRRGAQHTDQPAPHTHSPPSTQTTNRPRRDADEARNHIYRSHMRN